MNRRQMLRTLGTVAAGSVVSTRLIEAAFGQNGGPLMTCYVAWAHLVLGRPDEAREWQRRALDLADEVNDKFTRVATRWHAAFLYSLGGWMAESQALAEEVVAISAEESYAFWLALGLGLRGMLLAQDGKPAEAVPFLRDAVAGCDAIGSGILHTCFLGELADALWRAGSRDEARAALTRGRDHNDRLGQRAFESELLRREAGFLADEGDTAGAVARLEAARTVAAAQGATLFERRAAEALAAARTT